MGPGTGIAPFRSFWQQRQIDLQFTSAINDKGEKVLGDISMFFGCRHPNLDNIYAEEKQKAISDGALKQVHIAYSREPGKPKVGPILPHIMLTCWSHEEIQIEVEFSFLYFFINLHFSRVV